MDSFPALRLRQANDAPLREAGDFVLYWMTAARRATFSFALQRAVAWCAELGKPLVVLDLLPCGRRWDCDRFHRFALDGMADLAQAFDRAGVLYYPFVEARPEEGLGLLAALAARACVVVADDYPTAGVPRLVETAARRASVRFEVIDGNGLLPLHAADRAFPTAHSFRRFLQKALPAHLAGLPVADLFAGVELPPRPTLPADISRRWPPSIDADLSALPIDHSVPPVDLRGGPSAAQAALRRFLDDRLDCYAADRNHPDAEATSGLSPYLRFGHISAHEVVAAILDREGWSADRLSPKATGSRSGWWGVGENAEAFLDQIVTWREVGYNMAALRDDHDRYVSLPDWARAALEKHKADPHPYVYSLDEFEAARTHDPIWNSAQTQLRRDGIVHNYLRMLWGKKILEWSPTPEAAAETMIELNNKWALDGQDPNSYSGIFWCLGRYDRAWGPERPIFGKVRFMSSESAARKLRLKAYLARYSAP